MENKSVCRICPRNCKANRSDTLGFCGLDNKIHLSSAIVHYGEEPCFNGTNGVGNLFFTSCNLHCLYCQNYQISHQKQGSVLSQDQLAEKALMLQEKGVHFIGLVTPSHQSPYIRKAIKKAILNGLKIPIIYNSSAYDSLEELKKWEGLISIYLPDIKYSNDELAFKYSKVKDYVNVSREAITEMYRQVSDINIDYGNNGNNGNHGDNGCGIATKGLWVRHLVLPNNQAGTWESLCFLAFEISLDIGLSIMSQYGPLFNAKKY